VSTPDPGEAERGYRVFPWRKKKRVVYTVVLSKQENEDPAILLYLTVLKPAAGTKYLFFVDLQTTDPMDFLSPFLEVC